MFFNFLGSPTIKNHESLAVNSFLLERNNSAKHRIASRNFLNQVWLLISWRNESGFFFSANPQSHKHFFFRIALCHRPSF